MRSLTFTVEDIDAGKTLKQAVFARLRTGRHLFSRVKFQNGLLLDGIPTHADKRVQKGQIVTLLLPEDGQLRRTPQAIPLDIVYEDEDLLIVVKPAPLPGQASARQGMDTLENRVAAHLGVDGSFVYRPVNRLDKGVSGLMAIAKNAYAQQRLQAQLHTPTFVREYLAVTDGTPNPPMGIIDAPIGKVSPQGVKRCISPEGKPSRTHYETLQIMGGHSLLKLRLETGRTHQIRVHLQSIGCPIIGDFLYGQESPNLPGRLALHSCSLACLHPVTGALLSLSSPLPEELSLLLIEPL